MSMINLEKCQAITNGNIYSLQHDAEMNNGNIAFVGARVEDDVYAVEVPLTATLSDKRMVLIAADETQADPAKTIGDFTIAANTPAPAYVLTEGDQVLFDNTLLTGTPVVDEFLVVQNNSLLLKANATAVGKVVFKVVDVAQVIGKSDSPATRAIVEIV